MLSWESLSDVSIEHKLTLPPSYPRLLSLLLAVSAKTVFWNTHNQSAHINHPLPLCFDFLFTHVLGSNKAWFACLQLAGWSTLKANAVQTSFGGSKLLPTT